MKYIYLSFFLLYLSYRGYSSNQTEPLVEVLLETRLSDKPIYIKESPSHNSKNLILINPGKFLKYELSKQQLLERQQKEKQNIGVWRPLTLKVSETEYVKGYIYDHWTHFFMHKIRGDGLPIKHEKDWNRYRINLYSKPIVEDLNKCDKEEVLCFETTNPSLEFFIVDTQWVKIKQNINGLESFNYKLFYGVNFYYLNENSLLGVGQAWVMSDQMVRSFSYSSLNTNRCVSVYELSKASKDTKELFLDLGILKKEKTYLEKLDKKLFAFSENSNVDVNRFRRWLKTKVIARGGTEADPVLIREELAVGSEWDIKVGFHRLQLKQEALSEKKAKAEYEADHVHLGTSLFIPIFLDLEMILGAEISIPYQVPEELTLVENIYPVRFGQWFNYLLPPWLGSSTNIHAGFGLSFQTLFSTGPLPFAFESLVGFQLIANITSGRFYASLKFEPLGNNFNIRLTNNDKVITLGYHLTQNLESRNFAIFARYGILDYTSPGETELSITNFILGISKDF